MATGDTFLALTNKRLLGFQDFGERWFDYQQEQIRGANRRAFGQDGFFGGTQVTMSVYSGNLVQIDNDVEGADNAGNFLTTDAKLAGRDVGLAFQNTNGVTYSVALHYATRPRGININPRTGRPEWVAHEDTIGELHEPDAVAITGGGSTLTFEVDSVVDPFSPSAVNNAGRICAVWKKIPGEAATVEAAAVEEVAVTWSGVANQLVTTSLLGQVDPSTDASDYLVLMTGPTIVRQSVQDLADADGYLFVAELTGGSPPTGFNYSKQNDLGVGFAVALDQITRIGTNGDLKLSVDAHPSDVGESQIQVVNSSGSTVTWQVDEAGNVESEGTLQHAGLIRSTGSGFSAASGSASTFADVEVDTGILSLISGSTLEIQSGCSLDVQVGSTAEFAVAPEFLAGITMRKAATWDEAETDPGIYHDKVSGGGSPGVDGVTFPIEAQGGQRGDIGQPGGDGADLALRSGLPGLGAPAGSPGRLVKEWGDSAGYKWREYEWCSGEVAYSAALSYPLTVSIADGEIHYCEAKVLARSQAPTTDIEVGKVYAAFQANGGVVTKHTNASPSSPDFSLDYGTAILAGFALQPGASPNQWRTVINAVGTSGDAVIFVRWLVASLDGV